MHCKIWPTKHKKRFKRMYFFLKTSRVMERVIIFKTTKVMEI